MEGEVFIIICPPCIACMVQQYKELERSALNLRCGYWSGSKYILGTGNVRASRAGPGPNIP